MNYRLLNEVLIEWNESSKEDSDNVFLKSEDIKNSFKYFVYRLDEENQIKIFDTDWPEFEKYRGKVWINNGINNKHVELDDEGQTEYIFEPGEYRVYIKDINKVTDMTHMFWKCYDLISAVIPYSVTTIGEGAFWGCVGMTSISIPNSVTKIGRSAFTVCRSLTGALTIPNSVTTIGEYAFCECLGLTSVTIGNSVTTIDSDAFSGCKGLTSVTIPNSVTAIGDNAFSGCRNLKIVYVEDINKFKQIQFEGGSETWGPLYYGPKLIELKK